MNEVEGFALLERAAVRRNVPGFDWRTFVAPSPRHRLAVPLSEATVGLISTSGARVAGQRRFDVISDEGDPSFRVIPADTPTTRLRFNHAGYDVRNAYADPDCVFPLPLLHRYADEGKIGRVAARAYGLMGYITQTDVLLEETGPAIATALAADGVDLAFLVPA
ncbi:MAG TPA: glycine/sarcosine/betaine reductase selenoprotein B family protein [Candidatus Sulfomarinibacteraceae bacterium]|nr:glycine/sarcosine/betaine reductase selenoprotein B family protein [Candidatus Sulfomarinibacteraceae bacterium]